MVLQILTGFPKLYKAMKSDVRVNLSFNILTNLVALLPTIYVYAMPMVLDQFFDVFSKNVEETSESRSKDRARKPDVQENYSVSIINYLLHFFVSLKLAINVAHRCVLQYRARSVLNLNCMT